MKMASVRYIAWFCRSGASALHHHSREKLHFQMHDVARRGVFRITKAEALDPLTLLEHTYMTVS